jgi:hypothetical protein
MVPIISIFGQIFLLSGYVCQIAIGIASASIIFKCGLKLDQCEGLHSKLCQCSN